MRNLLRPCLVLAAVGMFVLALPFSASALRINEIRIDNSGADTDEYFELQGNPGESLLGLTYVVLGDAFANISGVVETAADLSNLSLLSDGLLSVHKATTTGTCAAYDVDLTLSFENSDNVTHMLVRDFTGAVGDDLDTNDDGILDITPWSAVVDCVALIETIGTGDLVHCTTQVGPDGPFVPGHVYFCQSTGNWAIGPFTNCAEDTPGDSNSFCPVSVDPDSWGSVKARYNE